MNHSFFILLLMSILCIVISAQKDTPVYGKTDKAGPEAKECIFDNATEARVLFGAHEVYCYPDLNSSTYYNFIRPEFSKDIRIKGLTEKGFAGPFLAN